MKQSILDFDLDYFLYPPIHYSDLSTWLATWLPQGRTASERQRRAWDRKYRFWMTHGTFRSRMRALRVPPLRHRRGLEHHQEALPYWLELVRDGMITPPFTVYHFDAHSDLFLTKEEESDAHFDRIERLGENPHALVELVHEANYLWWAVYLGLTDRIVWIVPEPQLRQDLQVELEGPSFHFEPNTAAQRAWEKQADEVWAEAFFARLKGQRDLHRARMREYQRLMDEAMAARYEKPTLLRRFGREVPVEITTLGRLSSLENPVAVNICRSPDYTPAKADRFFERFLGQFA